MQEFRLLPDQSEHLTDKKLAAFLKVRFPSLVAIADKLSAAEWPIEWTLTGLAFVPPTSIDGDVNAIQQALARLGIQEEFAEATRTATDLDEAEAELIDRADYDVMDCALHDPEHVVCDCCGADEVAKMTELEETYGRKSLVVFNDYDRGRLHGKLEALSWLYGQDWDDPIERHCKAKVDKSVGKK